MLFNYNILFLILLLLLVGCDSKKDNFKIISYCDGQIDTVVIERKYDENGQLKQIAEVTHRDSAKKIITLYDNGKIQESKLIFKGDVFGDNEIYFQNGTIQRYQFLVDSLHAAFVSIYDWKGRCLEQKGTPLVFKVIGTNEANDTLDIKFLFADKIFSSISSEMSINGIYYRPIQFENCDSEFRFNKVYRHIQDISNSEKIALFFKTTTVDMYTKKREIFYDTLNLSKTR